MWGDAYVLVRLSTRVKLLFCSTLLGGYSYSFQGSFEFVCITVTVSLFFFVSVCRMQVQKIIPLRRMFYNNSDMFQWFSNLKKVTLKDYGIVPPIPDPNCGAVAALP